MTPTTTAIVERDGHRLLVANVDGPLIGSAQDARDLLGEAWGQQATAIVVPVERLNPEFLRLRSGLAGEFLQKMANFRFAVIGDISAQTAESESLRAFVRESNRGRHIFFLPDLDALVEKLSALAAEDTRA